MSLFPLFPHLFAMKPEFNPWVGKISWRRKWLPIPVFLPGKCHGQRSLVVCSPWGRKESGTTEWITLHFTSLHICHEVMGLDAMIFVFWMLSFMPVFWLSSFTFIKRLFSSSLLSAIRMVSSAYLRLLIFLPASLIPACALSSLAFHTKYCADK